MCLHRADADGAGWWTATTNEYMLCDVTEILEENSNFSAVRRHFVNNRLLSVSRGECIVVSTSCVDRVPTVPCTKCSKH